MACPTPLPGTPSIYGLGIRISFYLLWFAIIAFNWLPRHLRGGFITARITHLVFSFAVFIGLTATISTSTSPFPPEQTEPNFQAPAAETYITLLLISSTIYLLIPLYLSRVMTGCLRCCRSGCGCGSWGETDYLLVRNVNSKRGGGGRLSSWDEVCGIVPLLEFIFLFLVGGMQCWFWWSGVANVDFGNECGDGSNYGFLFGKIRLDDSNFRGFNSVVVLAAMGGVVVFAGADAGIWGGSGRKRRRQKRRKSHISLAFTRELQTLFSLSVAATLLVAIELSIQWNGISSSVDQVSTSAQLIPLLITIAVILIGILHSLTATDDYGGSSSSGYGSSHSGSSGGSRSDKNSSGSSGRSDPVAGQDGVDWGNGQPFVPPPLVRPGGGGGLPVPPPPPPPGPAQPVPVYPPGVRTVTMEPPEETVTASRSSTPRNNHTEGGGGESGEFEKGISSSEVGEEDDDEKDTDNNYASDAPSGEGGGGKFDLPSPISTPFGGSMPTPRQTFPPPKWPPGWGQNEHQKMSGFPLAPMPAFMPPFPRVIPPPPV